MVSASVWLPGTAAPSSTPGGARAAGSCLSDAPARQTRSVAKASDFRRILSRGRCERGRWLRLSWLPADDPEGGHSLGLAVSKRLTGSSVQRNSVRRRLREQFRLAAPRLRAIEAVATLRAKCADRAAARSAADELRSMLGRLEERR